MEIPPKQEKEIHSLADIESMTVLEFINYLKNSTLESQKQIGILLDNQFYSKAGVTHGFLLTGIRTFNFENNPTREEAKNILAKMKNNEK